LDEESPVRPRRRTTRRKKTDSEGPVKDAAPSNGAESELAADELGEGELSRGGATPIDEEMLEEIRREVAADRASEDELLELAGTLPQEEDEAVEDEGWLAAGPVFGAGPARNARAAPLRAAQGGRPARHLDPVPGAAGGARGQPARRRRADGAADRLRQVGLLPDPVDDPSEAGAGDLAAAGADAGPRTRSSSAAPCPA
jgi:hypothetical protein